VKKTKQGAVRGPTGTAVLEGDPECPSLGAFSVFDIKPVHFMYTSCMSLIWKEKKNGSTIKIQESAWLRNSFGIAHRMTASTV
jgi:hypothetical protein